MVGSFRNCPSLFLSIEQKQSIQRFRYKVSQKKGEVDSRVILGWGVEWPQIKQRRCFHVIW